MRVRVYLRQALFTLPGSLAHVPVNVAVLEGECADPAALNPRVKADAYFDEKGRTLEGGPSDVVVPAAKLDHVQIVG